MNKDFNIRLLYFRYKDTPYYTILVISVVVIISFILFFQMVIPQIQTWFSIRDEILATRQRINTINQNIAFISSLDKDELDNQVEIATEALPFDKDFGGILHAITDASKNAGVSLDDYFFQVGSIASTSAQQKALSKDITSVKLTVAVRGDVNGISEFLLEVNRKIPLSEITAVEGDIFNTSVSLQFYQKQFPTIAFHDDQPLIPLEEKNRELLEKMALWKPAAESEQQPVSSESGEVIPLF